MMKPGDGRVQAAVRTNPVEFWEKLPPDVQLWLLNSFVRGATAFLAGIAENVDTVDFGEHSATYRDIIRGLAQYLRDQLVGGVVAGR